MKLFDAFNISKNDVVSLVGGGGKTSTMFALAEEAKDRELKTVLTTTTRIYRPNHPALSTILTGNSQGLSFAISKKLAVNSMVVAGTELTPDDKLVGLNPDLMPLLLDAGAELVIVEADGAARKPLKAPAAHEPVIPTASTVVIPVVGIDCLDQPIIQDYIHRPELVAELGGIDLGKRVNPEVVAKVLTHPLGFRKGLPVNCRWIPFINKVETNQSLQQAQEIAQLIGKYLPCRVVIGAARSANPVVEVIDFQ